VRRRAVGLGDEHRRGPEEVDLVAVDGRVDERPRQAVSAEQGEEALLELGAGEVGLRRGERRHRRAQAPRGAAGELGQALRDRHGVEEPQHLRPMAHPLEAVGGEDGGEVDEGAGGRGQGEAVVAVVREVYGGE